MNLKHVNNNWRCLTFVLFPSLLRSKFQAHINKLMEKWKSKRFMIKLRQILVGDKERCKIRVLYEAAYAPVRGLTRHGDST